MVCRLRRIVRSQGGQGTVEYAVVLAALAAILVGLGTLSGVFQDGVVVNHALASGSHHFSGDPIGAALDVFSF